MKCYDIYNEAYRLLDDITPICADCGQLCDKACCTGDDETGMFLFPFEEVIYKDKPKWLTIDKSDFLYTKNKYALIALCKPYCDRTIRPLSCRIFPLLPYLDVMGDLKIIMDPRGMGICPLIKYIKPNELSPEFINNVSLIFKVLIRFDIIYEFIFSLSRQIDEINNIKNAFK